MSIVDLTSDFLSYVQDTHLSFDSSWNTSNFLKSANSALQDISTFQMKIIELRKIIRMGSRFDRQKNNKMIMNIKENIKIKQQMIKRLRTYEIDIKGSQSLGQKFRDQLLAALQMRFLKASYNFKQAYEQNCLKAKPTTRKASKALNEDSNNSNEINLSKSHFLPQTQEQLIQQTLIKQYKQIQKSIGEISDMYKQSLNAVKMHDLLIGSIQNNVGQIDYNVSQGKKNISEVHRRQSKNRSLIIKMFAALYIITFVYIVLLS